MLFSSACEAYRIACGQETPRQTRAFCNRISTPNGLQEKNDPELDKSQTEEDEV